MGYLDRDDEFPLGRKGPDLMGLLSAVAEGLLVAAHYGQGIHYLYDGDIPVTNLDLKILADDWLIQTSLGGPPSVTSKGLRVLAEWDGTRGWYQINRKRWVEN